MNNSAQAKIISDFPALSDLKDRGIIYLDNAATTQKPLSVINAIEQFFKKGYGNINRSSHPLGEAATAQWEEARKKIKEFIRCPDTHEVIFTCGATQASNLVAHGFLPLLKKNSSLAVGLHDHHAQFVPWQQICKKTGAEFLVYHINKDGSLDLESFHKILEKKPAVVCLTAVSHITGAILPIKQLTKLAHDAGAIVVVDGSQEIAHGNTDISNDNPDFYFFSSHKMYGPTGIGALCGKIDILEKMEPLLFGGDMVSTVTVEDTDFAEIPRRFEAGTQALAEGVAFGAACEFLSSVEARDAMAFEEVLIEKFLNGLAKIPEVTIFGSLKTKDRKGIISFAFEGVHSHDVGAVLSRRGICARTGHFCGQPFMRAHGVTALTRFSLGIYTVDSEIEKAVATIEELAHYNRKKIGAAA